MKKQILSILFLLGLYVLVYFNFEYQNENIRNITNVLLWVFTLVIVLGFFIEKEKDDSKKNYLLSILQKTLLWCFPFTVLYYGNIAMGIIILIELVLNAVDKRRW